MLNGYMQHMERKHRSPNTIRLRLFYLTKFAATVQDVRTANHHDFENFIHHNLAWSQNTQQTATASLKSFYGWAAREGILQLNPTRDLPSINVQRRRPRIASEIAIHAALACPSDTDRAMVMLGAECGLRVQEIATLNLRSRETEWLHVIGKGNHQRTLHLSPELAELLDLIEASSMRHGWYFPGRSGLQPIHVTTAWRHITTILESNPHSLRRRAGTIVYRSSGNDIRLAQLFLGHSQSTTTELYLDVQDDQLIRAGAFARLAA